MKRSFIIALLLVLMLLCLALPAQAQATCDWHWTSCIAADKTICLNCGATGVSCNIGHNYSGYEHNAAEHWIVCQDCGKIEDKEGHSARCTNTNVCDVCGASGIENPSIDHPDWVLKSDAKQCWGVCEDCGKEAFRGDHYTFCTDQGKCSYCGYVGTGFDVYHSFDLKYDLNNHWKECYDCGEKTDMAPHTAPCSAPDACQDCNASGVIVLSHTEVIDKAVDPTCTDTGLTEGKHCSACGEVLVAQEVVKVAEHTEVIDKAVAPTCTETGLTEGKHCSVCNKVLVAQEVVKAAGHTEVVDKAVAPTCTESGLTEGKHCSVCGYVTVPQQKTSPLYHNWKLTSSTPATCTESGSERYDCSRCGYYYVDRPAPLGHQFDEYLSQMDGSHMAICALCDQGMVESCQLIDEVCTLCGYTVQKQEETPAPLPVAEYEDTALPSADITLEVTDQTEASLPEAAKNAQHVFQVALFEKGVETEPAGILTVKLPIENETALAGLKLMLVTEDGTLLEIEYEMQDGMIVFKTNQTGTFVFLP